MYNNNQQRTVLTVIGIAGSILLLMCLTYFLYYIYSLINNAYDFMMSFIF
jgi:hypothetical protein